MKFLFFSLFLTVLRSQQPSLFIDGVAAIVEDNIVLKSDLNQMVLDAIEPTVPGM